MKSEAETGLRQPQAKNAGATRSWKRQEGPSPRPFRASAALLSP